MPDLLVLVTGVSGFIAKHCAVDLINAGYRVRGTVRRLDKAGPIQETIGRHADTGKLEFCAADLLSDAGWREAMDGVAGVLHLASPFTLEEPRHPDDHIRPAVEGTQRVMKAAAEAGVPRFVQTSSTVAIVQGHPHTRTAPFTEEDWTNLDARGVSSYARSKTLAERAARDFVAAARPPFHFATVNPGMVLGPALDADIGASAGLIRMFLRGKYPGVPRLRMPVVDVRDVATAHRLALQTGESSGGRYLAVSESVWMIELARAIRRRLGARAWLVPRVELPDLMVRLIALVDGAARTALPELGRDVRIDNSRTRKALGMDFIPLSESAPATAESLIKLGLA